jgi:hypothetical protein
MEPPGLAVDWESESDSVGIETSLLGVPCGDVVGRPPSVEGTLGENKERGYETNHAHRPKGE